MKNHNRDLLVLYKSPVNQEALERTVECLHQILIRVECNEVFCQAHELVKRNSITQRSRPILRAASLSRLKPFHFLINKN